MEFYGTDWESLFSRIEEGEEELKCKRRSQFPNLPRNLFLYSTLFVWMFLQLSFWIRVHLFQCVHNLIFFVWNIMVVFEFFCLNFFAFSFLNIWINLFEYLCNFISCIPTYLLNVVAIWFLYFMGAVTKLRCGDR